MPELPEVEGMRMQFEKFTLNKLLLSCNVLESGGGPRHGLFDEKVLPNEEQIYSNLLKGCRVTQTGRRGKHMYAMLSCGQAILFHFGMTGSFVIKGHSVPQYKSFKISDEWPPKFTKIELVFEGGTHIAFCDPRRLGKVRVKPFDELFTTPPLSTLASDPLADKLSHQEVYESFQKTASPVKALILSQDRVFCGVGNWVADEVLYQADIHPSRPSNKLKPEEVQKLQEKVVEVMSVAVDCMAKEEEYPAHWLFHQRWRSKKAGGKMEDGSAIHFETVGGRTTAVVTKKRSITSSEIEAPVEEVAAEEADAAPTLTPIAKKVTKKKRSTKKKDSEN